MENTEVWIEWLQCDAPHTTMPPLIESTIDSVNDSTLNSDKKEWTSVERLLLIRALCESKTVYGASEYVKCNMGREYIVSKSTPMDEIENDMDNATPCIFVLSAGKTHTHTHITIFLFVLYVSPLY